MNWGEKMSRSKGIWVVGCLACLVSLGLMLASCGSSNTGGGGASASTSKEPIVIGAAMGLTGFMVTWDGPVYAAAQMAVDDINKAGGVLGRKLELIKSDTRSDAAQSVLAASEVLDKGAQLLFVSTDFDGGSPAALVAQDKGIISFSGAVSPKFGVQGVGDLAYSVSDSATMEAAAGAQFAISKGWKNMYALVDVTVAAERDFGKYFAESFVKLGGKVVGQDTFKNDDQSIAAQITHFKSLSPRPDVICLPSYAPGGPAALRQLRAAGIDTPVVGADDWDGTFWLEAVPGVKDVYGCVPNSQFGDDPNADVNTFFARLMKKMNKTSLDSSLAIGGYCGVQAYAKAIEVAGSADPQAVKKALDSGQPFETLRGPFSYTATEHILLGRPITIIGFWDGAGHFVDSITPTYVPVYQY
jgi:branched-chain amino acid transport system substrate-binding protein